MLMVLSLISVLSSTNLSLNMMLDISSNFWEASPYMLSSEDVRFSLHPYLFNWFISATMKQVLPVPGPPIIGMMSVP